VHNIHAAESGNKCIGVLTTTRHTIISSIPQVASATIGLWSGVAGDFEDWPTGVGGRTLYGRGWGRLTRSAKRADHISVDKKTTRF